MTTDAADNSDLDKMSIEELQAELEELRAKRKQLQEEVAKAEREKAILMAATKWVAKGPSD